MESVGYPASATRMALSRLCADGSLERQRDGRHTHYRLSEETSRTISAVHKRVDQFGRNAVWSGEWTLAMVSIPDALRPVRRKMHGQLTYLGFGRLREAVWIAARDASDEVARLAESLHVEDMVDVFLATPAAFTGAGEVLHRCWDMDALVERYRTFETRFAGLKKPPVLRKMSAEDSIGQWMQLTYDYEDLVHRDPELPAEFLTPAIRLLRERVVSMRGVIAPELRTKALSLVSPMLLTHN